MNELALRSWQAHARGLSDVMLHVLLRGLRNGDERIAASPTYYALLGTGLTPHLAMDQARRIEHQAGLELGGLNDVLDWRCWWHEGRVDADKYAALAAEVEAELARRERATTGAGLRLL